MSMQVIHVDEKTLSFHLCFNSPNKSWLTLYHFLLKKITGGGSNPYPTRTIPVTYPYLSVILVMKPRF